MNFERTLSPSLIWVAAKMWNMHDTLVQVKGVVDEKLRNGQEKQAWDDYKELYCDALGWIPDLWPDHPSMEQRAKEYFPEASRKKEPLLALQMWGVDLLLTVGWLAFRLNTTPVVDFVIDRLLESLSPDGRVSEALQLAGPKACAALCGLALLHGFMRYQGKCTVGTLLWCANVILGPADEYLEHDLALLKARERNEVLLPSTLPLERSSSHVLPPRIFTSHIDGTPPKGPSNMVGWQDVAHLRSFTKEEKKKINESEEKSGFMTTVFE